MIRYNHEITKIIMNESMKDDEAVPTARNRPEIEKSWLLMSKWLLPTLQFLRLMGLVLPTHQASKSGSRRAHRLCMSANQPVIL